MKREAIHVKWSPENYVCVCEIESEKERFYNRLQSVWCLRTHTTQVGMF